LIASPRSLAPAAAGRVQHGWNVVLLGLAAAAAVAGLWGGLVRLGLPIASSSLADMHGPLMVCGLFGTVISLERAVALDRRWALAAPLAFGSGGICILIGAPSVGAALFFAGGLVLLAASMAVFLLQRALFTFSLAVGALCMAVGDLVWMLTNDVRASVGLWIAFFVGTIAAERLELSRAIKTTGAGRMTFAGLLLLLVAGASLGIDSLFGRWLLGGSLLGLTIWLYWYDIARRVVRRPGATRFFASAMLAGYAWLGVSGGLVAFGADLDLAYDLQLHTIFLGFVLSMLMAHALIILPAVLGIHLAFSKSFYLPLALLHLSLLLRVLASTIAPSELRLFSGPVTIASLAAFAILVTWAELRARRLRRAKSASANRGI
jgi:hypothetical protein